MVVYIFIQLLDSVYRVFGCPNSRRPNSRCPNTVCHGWHWPLSTPAFIWYHCIVTWGHCIYYYFINLITIQLKIEATQEMQQHSKTVSKQWIQAIVTYYSCIPIYCKIKIHVISICHLCINIYKNIHVKEI